LLMVELQRVEIDHCQPMDRLNRSPSGRLSWILLQFVPATWLPLAFTAVGFPERIALKRNTRVRIGEKSGEGGIRVSNKRIVAEVRVLPIHAHLCSCWHQSRKRNAVAKAFGLVVDEEKSLVFLDRSTERAAKLIEIELLLEGSEIALGVELGIAKVLVERSVQLVGARLCRDQHVGPARVPYSAE